MAVTFRKSPPQRVLFLGGRDELLHLDGGGDQCLGSDGLPGLDDVARIALDLVVVDRVLEGLAQDGVEPARVRGRKGGVEGAKPPRPAGQLVRIELSDARDVPADPSLVVSSRAGGKALPVPLVPVVDDLGHRESTLDPARVGLSRVSSLKPVEELMGLVFCFE